MEAFNLTVANEDCCLYTYDIRKLQSAACVHKARPAQCKPAELYLRMCGPLVWSCHAIDDLAWGILPASLKSQADITLISASACPLQGCLCLPRIMSTRYATSGGDFMPPQLSSIMTAPLFQMILPHRCTPMLAVQDFVSAVMDVDYSPTGREFVAGGYDRSVRIFSYNGGHSREVYHTKRMQRVMAVRFSGDGSYIFSGSDDMNLRVWKVCTGLTSPLLKSCMTKRC